MLILPLMIFSGFFVNNGNIPVFFDWIKYLSPIKYGFSGLAQNEFAGLQLANCPFPEGDARCQGDFFLRQLALDQDISPGENIAVLAAFTVALVFLAFFGLWRASRKALAP